MSENRQSKPRTCAILEIMDAEVCYRAAKARDARFDGLFFTAVRTTGIFCRPVCPVRTPLRRNVEIFPNAAAARAAGYRPCLRCRPEVSPDSPVSAGTSTTVNRALRLIHEGALDNGSTARLAERLGLTDRHLRRLFLEHVGVPPIVVAETRRLLFAKKLITETNLRFAEIAFASGYGSLRRFNEAIRATYQRNPKASPVRAARHSRPIGHRAETELPPALQLERVPPLRQPPRHRWTRNRRRSNLPARRNLGAPRSVRKLPDRPHRAVER